MSDTLDGVPLVTIVAMHALECIDGTNKSAFDVASQAFEIADEFMKIHNTRKGPTPSRYAKPKGTP